MTNRGLSCRLWGRCRWGRNPATSVLASQRALKTYLNIGLDVDLNLGRTSVRQGKDLSLAISSYNMKGKGPAYTSGLSVRSSLLEVDSRVESVHQPDGVELGLDTLQEGAKEGRGSDD
jgi:hypothetical protein